MEKKLLTRSSPQFLRTQPGEALDFRFLRYIRIRNSLRLSVLALALALAGLPEFRKPSPGAFGEPTFQGRGKRHPGISPSVGV